MTEATGLMAHNWGFAIFLLGVVGLCAFMLGLSSLLGSKAWGRSKNEPFESGMLPTGSARLRLSAKFYLVAILLAGLVYLYRVGALDWAPQARQKRQAKLKQ